MNKAFLSNLLRRVGLIYGADLVRYGFVRYQNRQQNRAFRAANPAVALPPDYPLYETYQLNYRKYYEGGRDTAQWICDLLSPHLELRNAHLLDWGCGPGRVIRHLPEVLGHGCRYTGTDYNPEFVAWCRQHLARPDTAFLQNGIEPPLAAEAATFDAVYGISIFTHLSEQGHQLWFRELMRVTKPGGVLLFTTHGEAFLPVLTPAEQARFAAGRLVIRSYENEGHRMFGAFQPTAYLQQLFGQQTEVLQHVPGQRLGNTSSQDVWLLRKR
ncbi:class I SAM-dependent methyltransferase [Hymenobacter oligotrophus]|nr:class I SAM-dependent methyltransferase [Hymenobacter oligotrophus]